tara:strand:- start:353 stop:667 length:315 start_codon:yes stop_codon:yes gene_type:complete
MKFDHIAVNSTNIQRSVEWYCKSLGCVVEYADETWAMINCDGTKLALVLEGSHPPHIAFKVKSALKFPCSKEEVKKHRDNSSYYYGADPDGNIIEWVAYTNEDE